MITTYRYRFIRYLWGVAIDLDAEVVALPTYDGQPIAIGPDIWLGVNARGLTNNEIEYLVLGVRFVEKQIRLHAVEQLPVVICVQGIHFNSCDYQPEGLACAIVGWAAQEWNFDPPVIPIEFDRPQNRYVFHFPSMV